jgi:putative glutamine amidotransferase
VTAPLIGITAYPRVIDVVPVPTLLHTVSRYYVEAVIKAGGCPVILPVMDPVLAVTAVARLDGLVLPGGGDVDPACYGQPAEPETGAVDPQRDDWERACALAALDRDLPILAICRGAQVLNVALGGSLVQHVPAATGARHSWASRFGEAVHEVRIEPGSLLAEVVGAEEVGTNSLHHQAVGRPGEGVRPVAWAPDGTVEGFAVDGHPDVLAVQWHPELMADDPVQQRLFRDLVARAARRAL